jgi:hypothetical protein
MDNAAAESGTPKTGKKRPENYELLANRALTRARKLIEASDGGAPDPMAQFLMASANVLATLELADAIRGVPKKE